MSDKATTSAGPSLPEIRQSVRGLKPKPRDGETTGQFVTRAMADPEMLAAHKDAGERYVASREALREALSPVRLREAAGGAVVVLPLPSELAGQFPTRPEDTSPPHVTVAYLGDIADADFAQAVEAVREVAAALEPFTIELQDYGEFDNGKGDTIAHMIPRAVDGPEPAQMSAMLQASLRDRGVEPVRHPGPFRPHATLAYMPEGESYTGARPQGSFPASGFELWSDGSEPLAVPFSGPAGANDPFEVVNGTGPTIADRLAAAFDESLAECWLGGPRWGRSASLQENGLVQLFGSPAGKSQVAYKILPMFPPHAFYTEACAGGAAMFWAKPPAVRGSALSDINADLVWLYETCRDLTDADIATLREADWRSSRRTHQRMREAKRALRAAPEQDDKLARFHRELYLRRHGFKSSPDAWNPSTAGQVARTAEKLPRLREKLANAIVKRQDAAATVREFDGPDTFHFLDPPWPGFGQRVGERGYDPMPLMEALRDAHGAYLCIYQGGGFDRLMEMDPRARMSRPRWTTMNTRREGGSSGALEYRIIHNYDIAALGQPQTELAEAIHVALWAIPRLG